MGKRNLDVETQLKNKRKRRWITAGFAVFFVLLAGFGAFALVCHTVGWPVAQPAQSSGPGETRPAGETAVDEAETAAEETEEPTGEETEEPTAEETADQPTDPPAQVQAQAILDRMSTEEKIYQLFVVRPEALNGGETVTQAGEGLSQALADMPVGGIILFSQNVQDPEQCRELIAAYQSAAKVPLLVAVDEEGGEVSRLASNPAMGMTQFPPMEEVGQSRDPEQAYQVGLTIGQEIRALGFNLDLAPVADVDTNPDNPVIGNRAFSTDPAIAADLVATCTWGFYDAQVISCLKHFPGHGDTAADTHHGYAESNKTLAQMEQAELLPFAAGISAGAPMVMAAHIACPQITGSDMPASLSPIMVQQILRTEMGFAGVVINDAMDMGAITEKYPDGEAAVLALEAGCDIILMPQDLTSAVQAVETAVDTGRISIDRLNESVLRILTLKVEYGLTGGVNQREEGGLP